MEESQSPKKKKTTKIAVDEEFYDEQRSMVEWRNVMSCASKAEQKVFLLQKKLNRLRSKIKQPKRIEQLEQALEQAKSELTQIYRQMKDYVHAEPVEKLVRIILVFDEATIDRMFACQRMTAIRILSRGSFHSHEDFIRRVKKGLRFGDRTLLDCLAHGENVPDHYGRKPVNAQKHQLSLEDMLPCQIGRELETMDQDEIKTLLKVVLFHEPRA